MKKCRRCGDSLKDTNPHTVFCRDCYRKIQKGPVPPDAGVRSQLLPGFPLLAAFAKLAGKDKYDQRSRWQRR